MLNRTFEMGLKAEPVLCLFSLNDFKLGFLC